MAHGRIFCMVACPTKASITSAFYSANIVLKNTLECIPQQNLYSQYCLVVLSGWIDVMLIINGLDITLNEFRYSSNDVSRLSRLSFTLFLEVAYII